MDSALDALPSVPAAEKKVNASPAKPRKRKLATNDLPLELRILIDLTTAANLASVATRTMKRIGQEHPELVATLNRRRLFRQQALRDWLAAGCPAPRLARR
jgi:hypothetical protein